MKIVFNPILPRVGGLHMLPVFFFFLITPKRLNFFSWSHPDSVPSPELAKWWGTRRKSGSTIIRLILVYKKTFLHKQRAGVSELVSEVALGAALQPAAESGLSADFRSQLCKLILIKLEIGFTFAQITLYLARRKF